MKFDWDNLDHLRTRRADLEGLRDELRNLKLKFEDLNVSSGYCYASNKTSFIFSEATKALDQSYDQVIKCIGKLA